MKRAKTMAVAVAMSLVLAGAARGGVITFGLGQEYTGATPPAGSVPPPWLTATIDDGADDTDGVVTLTLAATNLTGTEKVKEWLFNLDPAFDASNLVFTKVSTTGTFTDPTISKGTDAFLAGGDGLFDIQFVFDITDGAPTSFGAGVPMESIQYTVTLSGGSTLEAGSFDFLSNELGGHGPYRTAAHVLSIGYDGEDSGWISTPEPATLALLLVGTAVPLIARRRGRA